MDDYALRQATEQMHELDRVRASIQGGERPSRAIVEHVLERGFGNLVALEAQLRRHRGSGAGRIHDVDGTARPWDAESESDEVGLLLRVIDALSDALTELRKASDEDGECRMGYGFVLPSEPPRRDRSRPEASAARRPAGWPARNPQLRR